MTPRSRHYFSADCQFIELQHEQLQGAHKLIAILSVTINGQKYIGKPKNTTINGNQVTYMKCIGQPAQFN